MPPPAEPDGKRATIRDVAAHAGVSIGTASKALNGQGKLRRETRDRVAAAARELGFSPNVLARGLLAGRTYTVGLITTDSFGRFSIPVMLGAEDALGAGQISVFMCDTRDDPDRERQYLEMLLQPPGGRADRHRPADRAAAEHRLRPGHPGGLRDDPVPGQRRARDPARRLRRRRARRRAAAGRRAAPGSATSPAPSASWRPQAGQRVLRRDRRARGLDVLAARRAVRRVERGLGPRRRPASCCATPPAWRPSSAAATRSPAASPTRCGCAGRRVPEDIALIGFDNWEPMALRRRPAAGQHRHVPGGRRAGRRRAPALGDQRRADPRRAHRAVPAGARGSRPDPDDAGQRAAAAAGAAGSASARRRPGTVANVRTPKTQTGTRRPPAGSRGLPDRPAPRAPVRARTRSRRAARRLAALS